MAYDRKAIKLPGKGRHPFLTALWLARKKITYADLARRMGVTPQAIGVWITKCRKDRNFLLPAEQVRPICIALGVKPATLRPDLYRAQWSFR